MSHVTTNLGDESGIQYDGIENHQENSLSKLTNMLMLVEDVPRGRLDKAMTVTLENKNLVLGRQAGNLYLKAVEDALEVGVSSIQVLRVSSGYEDDLNNGILKEQSDSFIMTEDGSYLLQEEFTNG